MSRTKRKRTLTVFVAERAQLPPFVLLAQRHYEKAPPQMLKLNAKETRIHVPMDLVRMGLHDPTLADDIKSVELVYANK